MFVGRQMKRIAVLVLVLLIAGTFVRDGAWTTAGYAEMLRDLDKAEELLACDCAEPTPECAKLCNRTWKTCGTPVLQNRQRQREALVRGDRPDVIMRLLSAQPSPFERFAKLENQTRSIAQ